MKRKFNFNNWLKDRDAALFSFDIDKITSYCIKYGAPISPRDTPNREKIILGGAAKAVLQIKTAPEEVKAKARQILDEYKFSYDDLFASNTALPSFHLPYSDIHGNSFDLVSVDFCRISHIDLQPFFARCVFDAVLVPFFDNQRI